MLLTRIDLYDGTIIFANKKGKEKFLIWRDDNTVRPNKNFGHDEVAIYPYVDIDSDKRINCQETPNNDTVRAFTHFYKTTEDDEKAHNMITRWLNIFHPNLKIEYNHTTIKDYFSNDSQKIFVVVDENYGSPETYIEKYQQLIFGSVREILDKKRNILISNFHANTPEEALKNYMQIDHWDKAIEFANTKPLTMRE